MAISCARLTLVWPILVFLSTAAIGDDDAAADRRKDQFPTSYGYLLAPLPYSVPGIGEGMFILGSFTNVFGTTTDPTLVLITGDAQGEGAFFDELPLYPEHLFLRTEFLNISAAAVNNYESRGMDTGKNDYNLLQISRYQERNFGLDLAFLNRKIMLSVTRDQNRGDLNKIRDAKGNIIDDLASPYRFRNKSWQWAAQLDMTDDYLDARKGVRINLRYQNNPPQSSNEADYFVTEVNSLFFVPTFGEDTLVLNYFQSDANVRKKGNIDRAAITQELGFNCPVDNVECLYAESHLVDVISNQRRYGTASSLGGDNRFRAFPQGRFNGAHVSFIGAEYRMNFVRESTPFNFYIWRDAHTGFQLAFFTEFATVSETWGDLWDDSRFVQGVGVRLVTKSGSVYRADLGVSDEGAELSVFFYYPWD